MLPAISFAYERAESDIMRRRPRRADEDRLVNRRLISFSYLQIGVIQALAGLFVAIVVLNDYGFGPSALPSVNGSSNWGSNQSSNLRWMYTEKKDVNSSAFNGKFFRKGSSSFEKFFLAARPGFLRQTEEEFHKLSYNGTQFNNMLKIIGTVSGRAPCRTFSCRIDGNVVQNDVRCFDPAVNEGAVEYTGIRSEDVNPNFRAGTNEGEGCFELWSENQQEAVLRRAQTAYLVSIIEVQWADGLICKSRLLSLFQHGMRNMVFNVALLEEAILGLLFVYVPFLNSAFQTEQLRFQHLVPALPFIVFIFAYDEARKWVMRQGDKGGDSIFRRFGRFVKEYTYW